MDRNRKARDEVQQGLKPLFPRLWRYCMALTGNRDRAGDLAQAVSLRVLEKAALFTPGSQFDRWVFRIAQRTWLNELRADSVRRGGGLWSAEEIDLPDPGPDPESNMRAREVLQGVKALPEAQRTTVLLVYVEGYSYKEASEILEIPIGTVMSRLAAARAKLSTKLSMAKSKVG